MAFYGIGVHNYDNAADSVDPSPLTDPPSLVGTSGLAPSASVGFDGEQPSSLPLLQPIWSFMLGYRDQISSPLFPPIMAFATYFIFTIPFTVLDFYGLRRWSWVARYKIQPDSLATWAQIRESMVLTVWNQLLYIVPISIAQWIWQPPLRLPPLAPGLIEFVYHHAAALLIMDGLYYVWHVVHHRSRWLYRTVHSVHHRYANVNCWLGQYFHPWELISLGTCATIGHMSLDIHPMTVLSYIVFLQYINVEDHCGYDMPFMTHRWIPFWGGAVQHDMHHRRPLTNFQPFFNYLDRLAGTMCPGQTAGGYKPKALVEYEMQESKIDLKTE